MADQAIHGAIHSEANDPTNITNPEHSQHHLVTPLQYTYVFITLLVFTAITCAVAFVDLKWANPVIAIAIACFKAMIVALFFMHAAYQSRLIKMTIGAGLFMFMVLISLTLTDYMSRAWGMW